MCTLERNDKSLTQIFPSDRDGETALRLACEYKYESLIKLLLERGADLYLSNNHGQTGFSTINEDQNLFQKFKALIPEKRSSRTSLNGTIVNRRKSVM